MALVEQANNTGTVGQTEPRNDVNANQEPTYIQADEVGSLQQVDAKISGSDGSSISTSTTTSQASAARTMTDYGVGNDQGNYIINDEDPFVNAATVLDGRIDDMEYSFDHSGLTRDQVNELISELQGTSDPMAQAIADALNSGLPIDQLLNWLQDPATYHADIAAQVGKEWNSIIATFSGQVAGRIEGVSLSADGKNVIVNTYDGRGKWKSGKNYSYSFSVTELKLNASQVDLLKNGVAARTAELNQENLGRFGFPSDFDPSNISQEIRDIINKYIPETFIIREGDYYTFNTKFIKMFEDLQSLWRVMIAIGMLMETGQKNWRAVFEIMTRQRAIQGEKDINLAETAQQNGETMSQGIQMRMQSLTEYIESHNNRVLQEKIAEAMRQAKHRGGFFSRAWHWVADLFTGGRYSNYEFQRKFTAAKEGIMRQYEGIQRSMNTGMRNAVSYLIKKKSGEIGGPDPFAQREIDVWERLLSDESIQDAGGGYWDFNKNMVMALKLELTNLNNLRKAYYAVKLAKGELEAVLRQQLTGISPSGSDKSAVFSRALGAAQRLESDLFVRTLSEAQQLINAHNETTKAEYEHKRADKMFSSMLVGLVLTVATGGLAFAPLIYGLTDYLALSYLKNTLPDKFTPATMQMEAVVNILNALRGSKAERLQAVKDTAQLDTDQYTAFFDRMEKQELEILAKIEMANLKVDAGDGFLALNEKAIVELRQQLESIQNLKQALIVVQRGRLKAWNLVFKIMTGEQAAEPGIDLHGAAREEGTNRMLAFQMKVDTASKQVVENNRQRQQELALKQARTSLIGTVIGIAVAALAIVATGGAILLNPMTLGIFAAGASLGNALANMRFQKQRLDRIITDVHPDEYFYEKTIDKVLNAKTTIAEKLDLIDQMAARSIDNINSGAVIDIGDGMWGIDVSKLMDARKKLEALRVLELAILTVEKSKENVQKVLISNYTGTSGDEDFEAVKIAMDARGENRTRALEAKASMVNDEINMHNQRVTAEKAFHRSMVQFYVSVAALAAYGISEAGKIGNAANAKDRVGAINNAVEKATRMTNVVNAVLNTYYAYIDSKQGMGLLTNYNQEKAFLDRIYKQSGDKSLSRLEASEKEALNQIDLDWVQSIGSGQMGLNMSYVFAVQRKIDNIYNAKYALSSILNAQSRIKNFMIGQMGGRAMNNADFTYDGVAEQHQQTREVIQQFVEKLQQAINRLNQISDAKKNLVVTIVSDAFMAIDSNKHLRENLESYFDKSLKKVFHDDARRAGVAAIAKQLLLSGEMAKLLGTWIYDRYYAQSKTATDTPDLAVSRTTRSGNLTVNSLNYLDAAQQTENYKTAVSSLQQSADEAEDARRDAFRDALVEAAKNARKAYFSGKARFRAKEPAMPVYDKPTMAMAQQHTMEIIRELMRQLKISPEMAQQLMSQLQTAIRFDPSTGLANIDTKAFAIWISENELPQALLDSLSIKDIKDPQQVNEAAEAMNRQIINISKEKQNEFLARRLADSIAAWQGRAAFSEGEKQQTVSQVKTRLDQLKKTLHTLSNKLEVGPEFAEKVSKAGSVNELLLLLIDFAKNPPKEKAADIIRTFEYVKDQLNQACISGRVEGAFFSNNILTEIKKRDKTDLYAKLDRLLKQATYSDNKDLPQVTRKDVLLFIQANIERIVKEGDIQQLAVLQTWVTAQSSPEIHNLAADITRKIETKRRKKPPKV